MPKKDNFHEVGELALGKDGWEITDEPLSLQSVFHLAVGQFINYRTALKLKEPQRQL
ncbi:MAG: element excision factor XisH family protein [Coleofasciculus sp. B1-GNL1-01]|uniref:element excision factor XisH family protein n=1 Tax=Coleofasciculus sp. B1-GNL1-01 TaxID=3068484 RepID=UPI0033043657